jgi:hypothetical protein
MSPLTVGALNDMPTTALLSGPFGNSKLNTKSKTTPLSKKKKKTNEENARLTWVVFTLTNYLALFTGQRFVSSLLPTTFITHALCSHDSHNSNSREREINIEKKKKKKERKKEKLKKTKWERAQWEHWSPS